MKYQKWCIIRTPENRDIVNEFFTKNSANGCKFTGDGNYFDCRKKDYMHHPKVINKVIFDEPQTGYLLITTEEFKTHVLKQNQETTMQYKSFAITGSVPLLKAMEETLVGMGMKSSNTYSFINGTQAEDSPRLVSNNDKPLNREGFLQMCAVSIESNSSENFTLPSDWDKAIKFIQDQLDYEEFKVGDWIFVESFKDGCNGIGSVGTAYQVTDKVAKNGLFDSEKHIKVLNSSGESWRIDGIYRKATPEEIVKAQEVAIDMGNFTLKVKDNKVFHKNEDITEFTKSLVEDFSSRVRNYGNPSRTAILEDVTFKSTGCEHNQTKLSDWKKVYDLLKAEEKKEIDTNSTLSGNIMDRVKTWQDAFALKGLDVVADLPFANPKNERQEACNASFKRDVVVEVLNEGWVPDWTKSSEYKYYPWFDCSGGEFRFHACRYNSATTNVGGRLVFRSSELAEYAGKQFLDLYKGCHK